jgi:hypothetical protein
VAGAASGRLLTASALEASGGSSRLVRSDSPRARVHRRVCAGVLATAVFVVGGAACAEQRAPPKRVEVQADAARTTPEATFRAQLGRTWELTRLGEQDIPASRRTGKVRPGRHPGPGSRPTLRFTSESAAEMTGDSASLHAWGWSFCNGYGMVYVTGPGDQLGFRHFQSTLVGCDGPDSLETRYFRALANTRRFEMDAATLSLFAGTVAASRRRCFGFGRKAVAVASADMTRIRVRRFCARHGRTPGCASLARHIRTPAPHTMTRYDDLLDRLRTSVSDDFSAGEPAIADEIDDAEHRHQVSFPRSYRRFLEELGALDVPPAPHEQNRWLELARRASLLFPAMVSAGSSPLLYPLPAHRPACPDSGSLS